MRRWVCPSCGDGNHAPDRPRKDDVRRFCLTCSKGTGFLVVRVCPALDNQRVQKAEQATQRRERRAARTQDRKQTDYNYQYMVGDLDILVEARSMWKVLRAVSKDVKCKGWTWSFPEVSVQRSARGRWSGHAYYGRHRITMTFPRTWGNHPRHRATVLEMTLHELTHLAHGHGRNDAAGRERHHDERFNQILSAAAKTIWGIEKLPIVDGYKTSRVLRTKLAKRFDAEKFAAEQRATATEDQS